MLAGTSCGSPIKNNCHVVFEIRAIRGEILVVTNNNKDFFYHPLSKSLDICQWSEVFSKIVLEKNALFPPKNINTPKSVTAIFELLITRGAWYKSVSIFFHYSYLLSSTGYKKFHETDWHQLFPSIENQHLNFGRWDTLST